MSSPKARTLIALLAAGLTIALAGCGAGNDASSTTTVTVTRTVKPDQPADAESGVRQVVDGYLDANGSGDYDTVCSLLTPSLQERAIEDHDPGGQSRTCPEAFQAEEDDLGDLADAANQTYAEAEIISITINGNTAVAVLDFGESEGGEQLTHTMDLRLDGDDWRITKES